MHTEVLATVDELRRLLLDEREALKAFDTARVELLSRQIGPLEEALREAYQNRRPTGTEERAALVEVRELALRNQVLLVHARACVQGIVACLTSHRLTPANGAGQRFGGGIRLNIQG